MNPEAKPLCMSGAILTVDDVNPARLNMYIYIHMYSAIIVFEVLLHHEALSSIAPSQHASMTSMLMSPPRPHCANVEVI